MGALEARDASYLSGVRRRQQPLAIGGALLAIVGGAYLSWAILRFDPHADPRVNPGFDRPIAELAFIFERGQLIVENAVPRSPTEARLMRGLSRNMQFSAGIMVLLLRIFVGTLAMLGGLIVLTVVVERGRLLKLIARLEQGPSE
jgi:hypothetical protein